MPITKSPSHLSRYYKSAVIISDWW